jgi:hypothetical protein
MLNYKKYLKYKTKYLYLKNSIQNGGNKHFNIGIRSFRIEVVLDALHKFLSAYPEKESISVGSGNGILEHEYANKYFKNILCIDPNWNSFLSEGLTKPFMKPDFKDVIEILFYRPEVVGNCVLILNWCDPRKHYDYDAVRELQPLAFFTIREPDDPSTPGSVAGSPTFHKFLRETCDYVLIHSISLNGSMMDIRIEWWQRTGLPNIKPSLPDRVESTLVNNIFR